MTGIPNNDLITSFGYIGVIDSIKQQRDSAMAEVRALQARIAELENGGGLIYNAQKRDANEREIIDALRAAGVYVEQMPVGSGFDLLCARAGILAIVEVKPVGVWKLTEAEQRMADSLRSQGVIYYVVHDPIEALDIFGLVDAPSPTGVSI